MRSKDIYTGQRVAVLSTKNIESYTTVLQYEVLDTRPWALLSTYSRWSVRAEAQTPKDVSLPEGVEWSRSLRSRPETGWSNRSVGVPEGTQPGVLAVGVIRDDSDPRGFSYQGKPTVLPLAQIKGTFEEVSAEVSKVQGGLAEEARKRREARKDSRERYEAAVRTLLEHGALPSQHQVYQRSSGAVEVPLSLFEELVSLATDDRR